MKVIITLILISFVAVAVFGFAGFSSDHSTAFMQCLKSVSVACSEGLVPMGVYHADIFMSFSLAVLSIFLLAIAFAIVRLCVRPLQFDLIHYETELFESFEFKKSLAYWLGRFETKTETLSI